MVTLAEKKQRLVWLEADLRGALGAHFQMSSSLPDLNPLMREKTEELLRKQDAYIVDLRNQIKTLNQEIEKEESE